MDNSQRVWINDQERGDEGEAPSRGHCDPLTPRDEDQVTHRIDCQGKTRRYGDGDFCDRREVTIVQNKESRRGLLSAKRSRKLLTKRHAYLNSSKGSSFLLIQS